MGVRIEHERLVFDGGMQVTFVRTLRIPDDGRVYPLPAGLGHFPLRRVDDYADRVPAEWQEHGGIFLPMYQREAMWLLFAPRDGRPHAIQVGVGKVCALTGLPWSDGLRAEPQNYLVSPPQPWLDGICVGRGQIRQFVAMPLGAGYTVEAQLTGEERHGGLQLQVFGSDLPARSAPDRGGLDEAFDGLVTSDSPLSGSSRGTRSASAKMFGGTPGHSRAMGLAAGGRMRQKLYPDPHGLATWHPEPDGRVFVHLANSAQWLEITGEAPPHTPITAASYAAAGLPWLELYDEGAPALDAWGPLVGIRGLSALDRLRHGHALDADRSVPTRPLERIRLAFQSASERIRDGRW